MGSGGRQNEGGLWTRRGAHGPSRGSPLGCWHSGTGTPWEEAEERAPGLVRPESVAKQDGAATGGAPRESRLRPPHPPAGGASFAVGQDVVARGGSCKGERCHRLGTILPVPSPTHGDEPPRDRQVSSTTTSPREWPGGFLSDLPASPAPTQTACHSGDRARPADVPALASRAHSDTPVAPILYLSGLPAAPPFPNSSHVRPEVRPGGGQVGQVKNEVQ